jgi:hypothetical protein
VWTNFFNGPGNDSDHAYAIALDPGSGNVIVAGITMGSGTSYDGATIAYSSAGVPLWTNFYTEPGETSEHSYAVAVDVRNGDVVVTGSSGGGWGHPVTIKYSSAGIPLWTNLHLSLNGWGQAVAVDASGNVFVLTYDSGSGVLLKYSSAGAVLWTRSPGLHLQFPSPRHMALDSSGNVFLTGDASYEGATIKYSNAGVLLWTRYYHGPDGPSSRQYGLAVAVHPSSGDVYVNVEIQGNEWEQATLKYSSAGVPLWTNWNSNAGVDLIAVDSRGDVVVAGGWPMIKYSSAGVPLWTNDSLGSAQGVASMALDASGILYTQGERGAVALSSGGVPLWTNSFAPGGDNYAGYGYFQVAVDASGSAYMTGHAWRPEGKYDFATVKYVTLPIITCQPLSRTNGVGTTASFTVEAFGGGPLSYQWRRQGTNLVNGGNISGVTTTNLLIANVQPADAAGYSVVVTNAWGSITSSVAQLTVVSPGRFTRLSYSADTGFSFIFREATVGQPYRIQFSPSLAEGTWTDWMSFTYTGPAVFTDMGALEAQRRFYRAVSP